MLNKITVILVFLMTAAIGSNAHPLGNFSVNNFTRIEVEKSQIQLHSVLEMAEIPTYQESQKIDTDKNGKIDEDELKAYLEKITPQIMSNFSLVIDNQPVQLQTDTRNISILPGAGNLPILRIEWTFSGQIQKTEENAVHQLSFENNNYKERVGWNEIVITRSNDIKVFNSTGFGSAVTNELKNYPENMLSSPLAERETEFSFTSAGLPQNAVELKNRNGSTSSPLQKDRFAALISVPEITPVIALFGLILAFGFGALHAMSPGHGKTVVGAYLVGSRGTVKHALFLGLTVTITHTLGVFAIGLITLFASNYILPEKIMPFLSFVSGLLVFYIGMTLFKDRALLALGWKKPDGEDHFHHHTSDQAEHFDGSHSHGSSEHTPDDGLTHSHGGSTHSHLPPENVTWKSLLALGISGGLLPCPSALVLMLGAISSNRIGYGLILTIAFSFGLATTLTGIGLIFLYLGKSFGGSKLAGSRIFKLVPIFSAFVIACIGAVICYESLIL